MRKSAPRLALFAAALAAVSAVGVGVASADDDPTIPTYADYAVTIDPLVFDADYRASTTIYFTTPGRRKPVGDLIIEIAVFNATSVSIRTPLTTGGVGSQNCLDFSIDGGGPFRCVIPNDSVRQGRGFTPFTVDVESGPSRIVPRDETWRTEILTEDADVNNDVAVAPVSRP